MLGESHEVTMQRTGNDSPIFSTELKHYLCYNKYTINFAGEVAYKINNNKNHPVL